MTEQEFKKIKKGDLVVFSKQYMDNWITGRPEREAALAHCIKDFMIVLSKYSMGCRVKIHKDIEKIVPYSCIDGILDVHFDFLDPYKKIEPKWPIVKLDDYYNDDFEF